MFLFGNCVNAGIVGDNVEVDGDITQSDGVPLQIDFRDVYGSILVDWFNVKDYVVRSAPAPAVQVHAAGRRLQRRQLLGSEKRLRGGMDDR